MIDEKINSVDLCTPRVKALVEKLRENYVWEANQIAYNIMFDAKKFTKWRNDEKREIQSAVKNSKNKHFDKAELNVDAVLIGEYLQGISPDIGVKTFVNLVERMKSSNLDYTKKSAEKILPEILSNIESQFKKRVVDLHGSYQTVKEENAIRMLGYNRIDLDAEIKDIKYINQRLYIGTGDYTTSHENKQMYGINSCKLDGTDKKVVFQTRKYPGSESVDKGFKIEYIEVVEDDLLVSGFCHGPPLTFFAKLKATKEDQTLEDLDSFIDFTQFIDFSRYDKPISKKKKKTISKNSASFTDVCSIFYDKDKERLILGTKLQTSPYYYELECAIITSDLQGKNAEVITKFKESVVRSNIQRYKDNLLAVLSTSGPSKIYRLNLRGKKPEKLLTIDGNIDKFVIQGNKMIFPITSYNDKKGNHLDDCLLSYNLENEQLKQLIKIDSPKSITQSEDKFFVSKKDSIYALLK